MIRLLLLSLFLVPMAQARPSFIVFLADDLGHGDLGCQGHTAIKTPNLDKLAKGGMLLTHCYASAPVCSPSRAGLLAGQHPYRNGIRDWIPLDKGIFLPKAAPSVAKLLLDAGYRTCHVGKWHLNSKFNGIEPTPGDHGFQHWFATQNNAGPSHVNPVNFVRNRKKVGPLEGNSSHLIADEAIRWLDGLKDEPFLLFVWFHAPHEPVAVPAEWAKKYDAIEDVNRRAYYACVTLMDDAVGQVLAALDRKKRRDDTLVFFTSDNGPETLKRYKTAERSFGSPGRLRGMKLHLTEGGIRVPGIVSWPAKIKPGTTSAEPVSNLDVLPTFCQLAGVKLPDAPLDGADVSPILQGKPATRKQPLYWQYDRALGGYRFALREGNWKLLADAKMEKLALYDLTADPAESRDRAVAEPDRVKRLLEAMKRRHVAIDPLARK